MSGVPREIGLNLVPIHKALADIGYAQAALEAGRLRDAELYAKRAESQLLYAERTAQAALARWREYDGAMRAAS